jgi:hypothetical protein
MLTARSADVFGFGILPYAGSDDLVAAGRALA